VNKRIAVGRDGENAYSVNRAVMLRRFTAGKKKVSNKENSHIRAEFGTICTQLYYIKFGD